MTYVLLLTLLGCPESEDTGDTDDTGDTGTAPVPSPYANCTSIAEYDDQADGVADFRQVTRFDMNGAITRQDSEMRADGTVTSSVELTNDFAGRALEQRTDGNADGTVDLIDAWTYDADGNVATWTQDENANGTPDSGVTYTYDGRFLQRRDHDDNLDGHFDHAVTVSWTHGATDIGVHESDEGLDGDIDFRSVYEYASAGPLLSQEVDMDVDGVPEIFYEYTYDEAWMLQRFQYTSFSDEGDSVDSYELAYDEAGRELRQDYDVGDDGIIDGVWSLTYDCRSS